MKTRMRGDVCMNTDAVEGAKKAPEKEEDPIKATGRVRAVIRVQNMFLDREIEFDLGKNIVTNNGLRMTLYRLKDNTSYAPVSHLAVGTSSAAESATQTALGQEKTRKSASISVDTTKYKLIVSANFSSSEINGCQEVGIFNASTGGTMLARKKFDTAIQIPEGFTAELKYEIRLYRA